MRQEPVMVVWKAEGGGLPWPKPMSSTRRTAKSPVVAAVRVWKGWETLNHCTMGSPTGTEPRSRVPLLAGRMAVAVPVRVT